jgi:hypothetical protein
MVREMKTAIVAMLVAISGPASLDDNIRASRSDKSPSKPPAAAPVPQSPAGTTTTVVPVAPNILAVAIAKAIIGRDFDARDCPTLTLTEHISDGTIAAVCSNGERFRIFVFQGMTVAIRCSAVKDLMLKALCGVPMDAGIKEMGLRLESDARSSHRIFDFGRRH